MFIFLRVNGQLVPPCPGFQAQGRANPAADSKCYSEEKQRIIDARSKRGTFTDPVKSMGRPERYYGSPNS
jgi:hypothetical protein